MEGRMRNVGLALLLLAGGGLAVTRAGEQGDSPLSAPEPAVTAAERNTPAESTLERRGLGFEVFDAIRYDDNILQLSNDDIRRLENGPPSSRFRVTSPDDWVDHLGLDVRWARRLARRRETRLDAGLDVYAFKENSIKNWSEYHLRLTQELTASRKHLLTLQVGASWIADYYLRELTDDDASFAAGRRIRRSAIYDQTSPAAALGWEVIDNRLTMTLGYERADRNYVHDFNERDGVRPEWSLEARIRPAKGRRLEITVGGSTGSYDAKGDLASTPIPDDDISYDFDGGWIGVAVPWGGARRGRVEVRFETEDRDYTTDNAFDLFHFGRSDTRREGGFRIVQGLTPRLDLTFEWRRLTNNSSFAAGVVPRDDVTDYNENRYDLGLRARFGSR
jgi:hypothetical protein